jgi:hypothetical protein
MQSDLRSCKLVECALVAKRSSVCNCSPPAAAIHKFWQFEHFDNLSVDTVIHY